MAAAATGVGYSLRAPDPRVAASTPSDPHPRKAAVSTKLVIVESPNKVRSIAGYLGPDFDVEASVGHIRDLAQPSELPAAQKKGPYGKFAVDVEDGFKPYYVINPDKRKTVAQLKRALKNAGPSSYALIHSLQLSYQLDNGDVVADPEGKSSNLLVLNSQHILVQKALLSDYEYIFQRIGLRFDGAIFNGLASAWAVVSAEEWQEGVCHLDMGASTIDLTCGFRNNIYYNALLNLGGNELTRRLAVQMTIFTDYMETIKVENSAIQAKTIHKPQLALPFVGLDQKSFVSKDTFCMVIKSYCDELVQLLQQLRKKGPSPLGPVKKIVLSGGGANIGGLKQYLANCLGLEVRLAERLIAIPPAPDNMAEGLRSSKYATVLGMLYYVTEFKNDSSLENPEKYNLKFVSKNFFKNFFKELF